MWVAKQNNKREHPATKQGIKTVLSKMHNCWFLFPPPPPNNATFISNPVLSMKDFQPPHDFFFSFSTFGAVFKMCYSYNHSSPKCI